MHQKQQEVVIRGCGFDSIHAFDDGHELRPKPQGLELEILIGWLQ